MQLLLIGASTALFFISLGVFMQKPLLRWRQYLRSPLQNILSNPYPTNKWLDQEFNKQEETFQKLALELHDQVGHTLSLAKLQLTSLVEPANENNQKIKASIALIGRSLEELRQISKGLHTDYLLYHGLIKAIEEEITYIKKSGNFTVDFEVAGISFFLDDKTEIFLFRIVQECLSNILKHARADTIRIHLNYTSSYFTMSVSDNGTGFEYQHAHTSRNNSSGLSNIFKRSKVINASVQIQSIEHAGTTISIKLPLHDKPAL